MFTPIDNEDKNISSVWDAFLEASYLIGRDFEISILVPSVFSSPLTLVVGNNNVILYNGTQFFVQLKEYHTVSAGTCYQIKSNFSIPLPKYVKVSVNFDNSLDEVDQPKVRNVLFVG